MLTRKPMKKIAFPSRLTTICGLLVLVQLCVCVSVSPGKPRPKYDVTWVRGRIQRQGKPKYAASRIKVTLVPSIYKNDESRAVVTYSGEDGIFDFKVPAGSYLLRVWSSGKEPKSYLINVRAQKYFDIVVIVPP
jgi:hypothetical protein